MQTVGFPIALRHGCKCASFPLSHMEGRQSWFPIFNKHLVFVQNIFSLFFGDVHLVKEWKKVRLTFEIPMAFTHRTFIIRYANCTRNLYLYFRGTINLLYSKGQHLSNAFLEALYNNNSDVISCDARNLLGYPSNIEVKLLSSSVIYARYLTASGCKQTDRLLGRPVRTCMVGYHKPYNTIPLKPINHIQSLF